MVLSAVRYLAVPSWSSALPGGAKGTSKLVRTKAAASYRTPNFLDSTLQPGEARAKFLEVGLGGTFFQKGSSQENVIGIFWQMTKIYCVSIAFS